MNEKKFMPKKKTDFEKELKSLLLEGKIIRYACNYDNDPLEVIGREHVNSMPDAHGIGQEESMVEKKIYCSRTVLHSVVTDLRQEYSVRHVSCSLSGWGRFATYAYYIDD